MAKKKKSANKTSKKNKAKKEDAEMKEKPTKKKKGFMEKVIGFLAWLTGVIVSLSVGFGMTSGTLTIPGPGMEGVAKFFGYVVIVTTLLSVVLAIIHKLQK